MPFFVISGKPNCPHFMHATHVAEYLSKRLPNFVYKHVEKLPNEWPEYIIKLNKQNDWHITESPLVWKEINIWGGKKHLIGGLSEFWEYVYCYYGLESFIPKNELEMLTADNLKFLLQHQKTVKEIETNVRVIAIHGASAPQTFLLIDSLLQISALEKQAGMRFKLFDTHDTHNSFEENTETPTYFNNLHLYGSRNIVTIADTNEEAVKDADILIHVEDFRRVSREDKQVWLKRCFISMQHLADILNKYAKRNCIVIMNNHGPVCFLATCLVEMCTRLKPSNIVAVTADLGLPVLNVLSEVTGIPVHNMSAPPVWGFVGLETFVDERHSVVKAQYHRPYERALTAPIGSTLPLGTMQSELRLLDNLMIDHDEITKTIDERHAKMNVRLNRAPILAKIRAVTSLLKLWFANAYSNDIISLGVCSNGAFGFTRGIVFSQPVKLDDKRKWVPFDTFPLLDDFTRNQIEKCVIVASEALQLCDIKGDHKIPTVDVVSNDSDSTSTQDGDDHFKGTIGEVDESSEGAEIYEDEHSIGEEEGVEEYENRKNLVNADDEGENIHSEEVIEEGEEEIIEKKEKEVIEKGEEEVIEKGEEEVIDKGEEEVIEKGEEEVIEEGGEEVIEEGEEQWKTNGMDDG